MSEGKTDKKKITNEAARPFEDVPQVRLLCSLVIDFALFLI
jgi:hypothetical protein